MTQENVENRKNNKIMPIIIILMAVIIIVLTWLLFTTRAKVDYVFLEKTEIERKNFDLQLELDSILFDYNTVKNEYDSVIHEKDSIILANAEEIQKLISSQADYRRIKKQLDHLRRVTQSYVLQIDSLHQANAILKEENVRIQGNFEREAQKTQALSRDKEVLTEKVEMASSLKAYQATALGIRVRGGDKEEITDRARRTDRIKVCFTISENPIVKEGKKNLFARIAAPDNSILTVGDGDEYAFELNGDLVQYSIKKEINYKRKAETICLYWDKTTNFASGTYNISLFIDDYEIGQTSLELR